MKTRHLPIVLAAGLSLPCVLFAQGGAPAQPAPALQQEPALAPAPAPATPPPSVRNVPYAQFGVEMPMVQRNVLQACVGRLGHMAMNVEKNILYVAAADKGAVEVHEVGTSKVLQSIGGLPQPSGALYIAQQNRLVISNARDGSCAVYGVNEHGLLAPERTLSFAGEAGPMVYDADTGRVWIGHGVFVSSFDPATGQKHAELQLGSSGRAAGLVWHRGKLLAGMFSGKGEVAVVDPAAEKLVEKWAIEGAGGLGAIAADGANDRIFAVSRAPARMFVLDGTTGATVATHDTPPDPGGAWYDAASRKVYVSCGGMGGAVAVYEQTGTNSYRMRHVEKTDAGSRLSLLIPEHRRLIVSCPGFDSDPGRLFIYQIGP